MPLTYPLALPSNGIRNITFRARSAVGTAVSPFTGKRQTYPWPLQMWEADVTLPPMKRADAESWVAFLVGLNGKEGTFTMGDPANTLPRDGGLSAALISTAPAIANGGFETAGAGAPDVLANWTESTFGTSAIARDTVDFNSGAASCRFDVDGSNSDVAVIQYVLAPGFRYRVSFHAKASAAGATLKFGDTSAADITTVLTTSWAAYSGTFTAVNSLFYFGRASAAGESLWIDDVQVHGLDTYGGLVMGAAQTGGDLITDGWLASQTNIMSAGDWLQIGTGSGARLHKVLQGANSNASGEATLLLWPKLRASPADNAAVIVQNPVGLFALADNERQWSIDEAKMYGISFSAVEVLT